MSAKPKEMFKQLSSTFPPEVLKKWEQMVEHWEANPKALNPYDEPDKSEFSY